MQLIPLTYSHLTPNTHTKSPLYKLTVKVGRVGRVTPSEAEMIRRQDKTQAFPFPPISEVIRLNCGVVCVI